MFEVEIFISVLTKLLGVPEAYRDVCVKSSHRRTLKHMEGVREREGEAEEEEEVEEEEERKSLVSSTHLSSSEYSARIGKAIQSDGCLLPPWPYKAGCFRSVAMAAAHSYLAVRGNCLGHSHRDVDANTHTHTHTLLYVLTHTCLRLHANRNTTERKRKRKKSRTSHTSTAHKLLAVRLCGCRLHKQLHYSSCWPTLPYSPN